MESQLSSAKTPQILTGIIARLQKAGSQANAQISSDESAFRDMIAQLAPAASTPGSLHIKRSGQEKCSDGERKTGRKLKSDDDPNAQVVVSLPPAISSNTTIPPDAAVALPNAAAVPNPADVQNSEEVASNSGVELASSDIRPTNDARTEVIEVIKVDEESSNEESSKKADAVIAAKVPRSPRLKAERYEEPQNSASEKQTSEERRTEPDSISSISNPSTSKNVKNLSESFGNEPFQTHLAVKHVSLDADQDSSPTTDLGHGKPSQKSELADRSTAEKHLPQQLPIAVALENTALSPSAQSMVPHRTEDAPQAERLPHVIPPPAVTSAEIPTNASNREQHLPVVQASASASIPQIQTADLVHRGEKTELKVELKTAELGHVQVTAGLRDETVHATVKVESSEVREMIASAIGRDENKVGRHELTVQAFDTTSGMGSESNQQQQDRPVHVLYRSSTRPRDWSESPRPTATENGSIQQTDRAVDLHA